METYIRSALFVPANSPSMIQNSDLLEADAIIYDLEDAISPKEKDSARILLDEAFKFFKKTNVVRIVRVNPIDSPFFYDDVEAVKNHDIDFIMLAKASQESVKELEKLIKDTDIKIIALIESAHSLFDLANILQASPLVKGMLFGAEDYSLDMQISRTIESDEILVARQNIATTCKALDIFSIDTPFTHITETDALIVDAQKASNYGFDGKACIHPSQVGHVNTVFSPTREEVIYAREVLEAAADAAQKGIGVFSYKGKMVDAPIINRANLTIENAKKAGVKYE